MMEVEKRMNKSTLYKGKGKLVYAKFPRDRGAEENIYASEF